MHFVECPTKLSLFKIRGTTACNIKESCTAVSCCVEVGKLGRTFEVVLDIDFCNQKITFGIEKLTETLSLQMFEFGKYIIHIYTWMMYGQICQISAHMSAVFLVKLFNIFKMNFRGEKRNSYQRSYQIWVTMLSLTVILFRTLFCIHLLTF